MPNLVKKNKEYIPPTKYKPLIKKPAEPPKQPAEPPYQQTNLNLGYMRNRGLNANYTYFRTGPEINNTANQPFSYARPGPAPKADPFYQLAYSVVSPYIGLAKKFAGLTGHKLTNPTPTYYQQTYIPNQATLPHQPYAAPSTTTITSPYTNNTWRNMGSFFSERLNQGLYGVWPQDRAGRYTTYRWPFRDQRYLDQSVIAMGLTPRYTSLQPALLDPWAPDPYEPGGNGYTTTVNEPTGGGDGGGGDGGGGWGGGYGSGSYSSSPAIYGDSVQRPRWYTNMVQWNI